VKVGDLVKLKEGTHEDGIPEHRTAVIVSELKTDDTYELMFFGSEKTYRFNKYFVLPLQKIQ
jgi:hypothetical protein